MCGTVFFKRIARTLPPLAGLPTGDRIFVRNPFPPLALLLVSKSVDFAMAPVHLTSLRRTPCEPHFHLQHSCCPRY